MNDTAMDVWTESKLKLGEKKVNQCSISERESEAANGFYECHFLRIAGENTF